MSKRLSTWRGYGSGLYDGANAADYLRLWLPPDTYDFNAYGNPIGEGKLFLNTATGTFVNQEPVFVTPHTK